MSKHHHDKYGHSCILICKCSVRINKVTKMCMFSSALGQIFLFKNSFSLFNLSELLFFLVVYYIRTHQKKWLFLKQKPSGTQPYFLYLGQCQRPDSYLEYFYFFKHMIISLTNPDLHAKTPYCEWLDFIYVFQCLIQLKFY